GRHKDLERSRTSWKSVSPVRNKILVYPDSDEEDEEYCSLPPLLPCFQTPQPYATFNFVHHNSHSEVDIKNMSLEEYEDSSLDEILDDLFRIGAKNIRKMEHEVPNRCDNITDYEDSDQEDGELPDLPNFFATNEFASVCEQVEENIDVLTAKKWNPRSHQLGFMWGYEFAQDTRVKRWSLAIIIRRIEQCSGEYFVLNYTLALLRGIQAFEQKTQDLDVKIKQMKKLKASNGVTTPEQVEDNIDIAEEKEEVPIKDVEMDEHHDIDHSGYEEALQ
nr:hypothetical protein [Tanacetum cinerariifolium]